MTQTEFQLVDPTVSVIKKRKCIDRDLEDEENEERTRKSVHKSLSIRSKISDLDLWNSLKEEKGGNRTPGVITGMEPNLYEGSKASTAVTAYLCSPSTDHITSDMMDLGWGCGYRNCQMLMSFLEHHVEDGDSVLKQVPDIPSIQIMLEKAWKEGFDPEGAKELQQSVTKSNKWIGTTEVYSLLAYLGVRSSIIDFHQPDAKKLHTKLMDWIELYFTSNVETDPSKKVYITDKPPLYLQHQGHSRTVVGIELLKSGRKNLIMFDPGQRPPRTGRMQGAGKENKTIEKYSSSKVSLHPSLLRPHRVDAETIARNKQYQVLALGQIELKDTCSGKLSWNPGYLLDEKEREAMKSITSLVVL